MTPIAAMTDSLPDAQAPLPDQLMAVVSELTEVISEENGLMAEGMPAAVVETIDRKLSLSDAYEDLYLRLVEEQPGVLADDPVFAAKLTEAVSRLREVTAENMVRLEAAMEASRRRVEAVMAAMRATVQEAGPYGAKGEVPLSARLAAFGRDYHA